MPCRSHTTPEFDNHLCATKKINALEHSFMVFCQFCFSHNYLCVVMDDHKKCAHYTCCKCSCVSVSWDTLNKVHDKLKLNIQNTETDQSWLLAEQTCVTAKLDCLCKTLQQMKDHAKVKTLCLLQELSNDEETVENPLTETLSQIFNAMPVNYWQSNSLFPPQNIEVFLHSSWDFVWVFKLTLRYCILSISQDSELSH